MRNGLRLTVALTILLVFPPVAAVAEDGDDVFTFEGGGFGHSVGMSQFGAYGMAREGHSWQQILTHYFRGSSVATVDPG
ncbi:MAG: hypothetical protein ACE5KX_08895, partial [Acidimicrobiia bacterium]